LHNTLNSTSLTLYTSNTHKLIFQVSRTYQFHGFGIKPTWYLSGVKDFGLNVGCHGFHVVSAFRIKPTWSPGCHGFQSKPTGTLCLRCHGFRMKPTWVWGVMDLGSGVSWISD